MNEQFIMSRTEMEPLIKEIYNQLGGSVSEDIIAKQLEEYINIFHIPVSNAARSILMKYGPDESDDIINNNRNNNSIKQINKTHISNADRISNDQENVKIALVQVRDTLGIEVFQESKKLCSALRDLHLDEKEVYLISIITGDFGDYFRSLVKNDDESLIRRLSSDIANKRFINDEQIVSSKIKIILKVMEYKEDEIITEKINSDNNADRNPAGDDYEEHLVNRGELGTFRWSLDLTTKELTISGHGKFESAMVLRGQQIPWKDWKEELKSVVFESGVDTVPPCLFKNFGNLEKVSFAETVKSIGREAFCNCSSLKSIYVPQGVEYIGVDAFAGCTALEKVVIPDSVRIMGDGVFNQCWSLSVVTIPGSLTQIKSKSFGNCTSLKSVVIKDGVVSIGKEAFICCKSLDSIILPKSLKKIDSMAFWACSSLDTVILPSGFDYLGKDAFPPTCVVKKKK